MSRKIALGNLDPQQRSYFAATATEHTTARKISAHARETFAQFAGGDEVDLDALTNAIVEGTHADVTLLGTSSTRRRQADPLLALWTAVRSRSVTVSAPFESVTDRVAIAERRFALTLLTPEQRSTLNTYSRGFRDALGSA